jgi:hypothetical protein
MPVKTKIHATEGVFFITFTCYEWRPLIQICEGYDLVYHWFDYLKSQGHHIIGYVIMPNHLHAVIAFRNCGKSINTIIGNGKRFLAYDMVKRLNQMGSDVLLYELQAAVKPGDKSRSQKHEVWEDSFDWKECLSDDFIRQKLEYMHRNPCSGKWNLAENIIDYPHSSILFYETGQQGGYPVTSYLALKDLNLAG